MGWNDGYVVHYHDALNYDIDLPVDYPECRKTSYRYLTVVNDVISDDSLEGHSYRCRLQGIKLRRKNEFDRRYSKRSIDYRIHRDINNIINIRDGWIKVSVIGVDQYRRLLINILLTDDNGTSQTLTDYLLRQYPYYYERFER
jgi:hypothetical protein